MRISCSVCEDQFKAWRFTRVASQPQRSQSQVLLLADRKFDENRIDCGNRRQDRPLICSDEAADVPAADAPDSVDWGGHPSKPHVEFRPLTRPLSTISLI